MRMYMTDEYRTTISNPNDILKIHEKVGERKQPPKKFSSVGRRGRSTPRDLRGFKAETSKEN